MGKGWQTATETAERITALGKVFVRLENDGDKIVGAFLGDPHTEEVVWNEKTSRNETFTKQHEEAGKKPSAKFLLNFYAISEGNEDKMQSIDPPSVRVFSCSLKTFKLILKARDKYGLDNKFFEVERKGKKGDTQTSYTVLPDVDIPSELKPKFALAVAAHETFLEKGTKVPEEVIKLHDLVKIASGDEDEGDEKKNSGKSSVLASDVAEDIKKRLKQLPRAQIDKFLNRFGVSAIKEVKAEDTEAAKAFVAELEGKAKTNAEAPKEIDPFA